MKGSNVNGIWEKPYSNGSGPLGVAAENFQHTSLQEKVIPQP